MENESFNAVIGNRSAAPYINTLADGGVSFTRMRAVTHPSQPNYLELFSGDNQGITSDGQAPLPGTSISTPNLAANLRARGKSFTAFCDGLPAAGDITSDNLANGYVRRHCPWIRWITTAPTLPPNKLPPEVHQPFTAFPADFSQLPTVSFVIPSNLNNMHDFGVASGDNWLAVNLSAYAEWAKDNNSLLIVTWDEDSFLVDNLIPTVFHGARLRNGTTNPGAWTLHNLLRTIEDMYSLPHAGRPALLPAITGCFEGETPVGTILYSQMTKATLSEGSAPILFPGEVSTGGLAGARKQALLRFENLFTTTGGYLLPSVPVLSAKVIASTRTTSTGAINAHRMLVPWTSTATWTSMVGGIAVDNVEAEAPAQFSMVPNYTDTSAIFDATSVLNLWRSGTPNYGWVLLPAGGTSWTGRPTGLEVTVPSGTARVVESTLQGAEGKVASVKLVRTGDPSMPASVGYTMVSLTAMSADYNKQETGTITWAAGQGGEKTLDIQIFSDGLAEGDERFEVRFSSGILLPLEGPTKAVVTIKDAPFDQWGLLRFNGQGNLPMAADLEDPDGDGLCNLAEYSRDSDPLSADSTNFVTGILGEHIAISFTRNPAATDLVYTVQASSDLTTWADGSTYGATTIPNNAVTTEVSRTPVAGMERITVRDNLRVSEQNARYLRLRVRRN
jgi:hypothetical protein